MKPALTFAFTVLLSVLAGQTALPARAQARVQLLTNQEPLHLFGGTTQTVTLTWQNAGNQPFAGPLSARVYQAGSAIAAPLGTAVWKNVEILPGQTVLESSPLAFPAVRAETRFVLQWFSVSNQPAGVMEASVYPDGLLRELRDLAGPQPPGLLDPQNALAPSLKAAGIEYSNLMEARLLDYMGRLIIVGPLRESLPVRTGLTAQLQLLAERGVGVVLLLSDTNSSLRPSFYTVRKGKGAVVVAQSSLVARLRDDPLAQLTLLQLARLALHPETPRLPDLNP